MIYLYLTFFIVRNFNQFEFVSQCFSAMTLFYCAHWQSYVSGTLRLGKVDVTEAQCMIMLIHLISAVFGPTIWMAKVFNPIFSLSFTL